MFIWLPLVLTVIAHVMADSCQTPFQTKGDCTYILDCPFILNLLHHSPKKILPEFKMFLKSFQCETGTPIKVCCPKPNDPVSNLMNHMVGPTEISNGNDSIVSGRSGLRNQCLSNIPDPLSNCSILNQTAESLHVKCTEGFDGGLQQEFIMEVYDMQTRKLVRNITSKNPIFTVGGLESDYGFNIVLYATNRNGQSGVARLNTLAMKTPEESTEWVVDDEGCRTPDRGVGECILINNCQPIMDVFEKAPKPLPMRVVNLLKQYSCGYEGKRAKVCCPSGPIRIPWLVSLLEGSTGRAQEPPDVSNHRNYRLLPKNCGHLDNSIRIVNGQKADLFEFPWMALLSYNTRQGPKFSCGGTIINNKYILTAAHCITNLKYPLLGVRVGEYNINNKTDCQTTNEGVVNCAPPVQDLGIEQKIPHSLYNSTTFENDIGLLRVTRLDFTKESTRPVCLPIEKARTYNFAGKNVIVTGWGATETENNSPDLLKVELPVIDDKTCQEKYKGKAALNRKQLCAGGKDQKDTCPGDSGGPLHTADYVNDEVRYVQQGLVSFGPKFCGLVQIPGVYTRIAFYMDWILDNIRP